MLYYVSHPTHEEAPNIVPGDIIPYTRGMRAFGPGPSDAAECRQQNTIRDTLDVTHKLSPQNTAVASYADVGSIKGPSLGPATIRA